MKKLEVGKLFVFLRNRIIICFFKCFKFLVYKNEVTFLNEMCELILFFLKERGVF